VKVLVAGGTGFVGSHVVEALGRAGHDVRSLARRPTAQPLTGVEYVTGDLGNVGDVEASMAGVDAAVFAATTTTPGSAARDASFDASTNVVNGVHFAHAAAQAGIRRTVMISSGGTVYGVPSQLPVREESSTEPISTYGVSKLAIEKYLAVYALGSGGKTTILRAGNAFGERQLPGTGQGAPAAFMAALLRDRPIEIWGDGSIVRDYVYAGDIGLACAAALRIEQPEACLVVNVGSGVGLSLRDLVERCGEVVGRTPRVTFGEPRPFDVQAVVLDIERARARLEWEPATPLETGLRRQAAWLDATLPA
jgi:UDP-glucose 4-epimerase